MTRNGLRITIELRKRGWTSKAPPNGAIGDPRMVDPIDGKEYTCLEAEKVQQERDKLNEHAKAD